MGLSSFGFAADEFPAFPERTIFARGLRCCGFGIEVGVSSTLPLLLPVLVLEEAAGVAFLPMMLCDDMRLICRLTK
jgi:hypothetical protein